MSARVLIAGERSGVLRRDRAIIVPEARGDAELSTAGLVQGVSPQCLENAQCQLPDSQLYGRQKSQPKPRAKVIVGPATLYCGDAYHIRPTLGFFDADVMDPPYVIKTAGGGSFRKHRPYLDQIEQEGLDRGFEHRIINPLLCGSVVVFCHNDQLPGLSAYLDGLFHRFALCVWKKLTPMPVANKHYVPEIELYFHAWNRGYHPDGELADKRRVFECRSRALRDFGHPTVKPDQLMDKILRNVSGETICDPFMGTGSTGVAAIRAGKRITGIEHNPKHFATAVERISAAWAEIEASHAA